MTTKGTIRKTRGWGHGAGGRELKLTHLAAATHDTSCRLIFLNVQFSHLPFKREQLQQYEIRAPKQGDARNYMRARLIWGHHPA